MSTNVIGGKPVKKKTPTKKKTATKKRGGRAFTYAPFNSDGDASSVPVPDVPAPVAEVMPSEIPSIDGGAKKKKKVKRKPGKYALFVKAQYPTVAKAHPKWKATDCIKEIAKMWKEKNAK